MAERWTKQEDQALLDGIGTFGLAWLIAHTHRSLPGIPHRSAKAIYARANRIIGSYSLLRGAYTLRKLVRDSGYSPTQILRAMRALGQKWKRLSSAGAYLITDEQVEELYVWLEHDYWVAKLRLYACKRCGERKKPHKSLGLCVACYFRYRRECKRLGLPVAIREQWSIVRRLLKAGQNEEKDDKLLRRMVASLRRGKALDAKLLEVLARLGGHDGSGASEDIVNEG